MLTLLSIAFLIILIFGGIYISRLRGEVESVRKEMQSALDTEQTVNYFAVSMFQQNSVDDILWDITKNCISRLNFEDCVIYLHNPEKNVLVQKAAYGPKNPQQFDILNPIEIPVGKGIVGYVFEKGEPEIIGDTSNDSRYILDDQRRRSEITVPIIYRGKKFGIIDSEHSDPEFFTQKHLQVLNAIASLCAVKIDHALREEAFHSAEMSLHENNRKLAETRLASLRLQLNPHFIFNSINSINNFIVHGERGEASMYLTAFSRFIREIFENTHAEWISLEKEIHLLKLYTDLEQLRFENKFRCDFIINDTVNPRQVLVPPLLIQPIVENSIWHGLLHRDGNSGILQLRFWRNNERLFISIEDNGVGREYSAAFKGRKTAGNSKSGMTLCNERISLMNNMFGAAITYAVEDIHDESGAGAGTRVVLSMMIKELNDSA